MHDLIAYNQWNMSLFSQNRFIETKSQFGNYVLWFPGIVSKHAPKFQRRWFGQYIIQYCLRNNIVLFVTIDRFDPNLILVNINKLSGLTNTCCRVLSAINMYGILSMNIFKHRNMNHYLLNLKIFNS
jgi:hypothetical protein